MRSMIATLYPSAEPASRRLFGDEYPTQFVLGTEIQDYMERMMESIGFSSSDYTLSWGEVVDLHLGDHNPSGIRLTP